MKRLWPLSLTLGIVIGLSITGFFVSRSRVPTVQGAFEIANAMNWISTGATAAYGFLVTLIGVFIGAAYRTNQSVI